MRNDVVPYFFQRHAGAAIGLYPEQKEIDAVSEHRDELIDWSVEHDADYWAKILVPEAPAQPGEFPTRYIDGCHVGHAVACLRAPSGWPIPVFLAEVGGVAMCLNQRDLVRDFYGVERVVSFVTDAFPWPEVEELATALANLPDFPLRLLPANRPAAANTLDLFDYERMRKAAQNRANYEMANWESIAFLADTTRPALVDGRLEPRLRAANVTTLPLVVGLVKTHTANLLHPHGWRTLYGLTFGHRTPFFKIANRASGTANNLPVATWFLKLGLGTEVQPNWAIVRVEVPWAQLESHFPTRGLQTGFVNRLSRWLIDARCRQSSYARMPVSLEPIVRAEESLKSLFTPFGVLRNRFLRHAGVVGGMSS